MTRHLRSQRRSGGMSKTFARAILYLLALFGTVSLALGVYQYDKIRALYSIGVVLGAADSVEMTILFDEDAMVEANLSDKQALYDLERALKELNIESQLSTSTTTSSLAPR